MKFKVRILFVLLLIMCIFIYGIVGYEIIEGWDFLDSAYMVVITLTSVGYREIHPLSSKGMVFTISLILMGIGILMYGLTTVAGFVLEGDLQNIVRRRKMEKRIKRMKGHYIICGAGNTGKNVMAELMKTKCPFVVIDPQPERIEGVGKDIVCIKGNATYDAILMEAGIMRAKGLVAALPNDADNLFLVFTARSLNPELRIVAKCIEEEAEIKLRKAGADSVVSPNIIGGLRMASELIRPVVVSYLDTMLREKGKTLRIEQAVIGEKSKYIGIEIGVLKKKIEKELELLVIALHREGEYIFNPPSQTVLQGNDVIIVMGEVGNCKKLKEIVG